MTRIPRRARAIAIAETRNARVSAALTLFALAVCVTAALLALPHI